MARATARFGIQCSLVGQVGNDAEGDRMLDALTDAGVDVATVTRNTCYPTGRYLALHDPDGSLAAATVDGRITDTLSPGDLDTHSPAVARAPIWFLDANLPSPVLKDLTRRARIGNPERRLIADAVSPAKAGRLVGILADLDCLFCNRIEAERLLSITSRPQPPRSQTLVPALLSLGPGACVVTDSANPIVYAEDDEIQHLPIDPAPVVDVTGAGDALIAGTLAALARGRALKTALRGGIAAARLTVSAEGAAPENLRWETIATAIGDRA